MIWSAATTLYQVRTRYLLLLCGRPEIQGQRSKDDDDDDGTVLSILRSLCGEAPRTVISRPTKEIKIEPAAKQDANSKEEEIEEVHTNQSINLFVCRDYDDDDDDDASNVVPGSVWLPTRSRWTRLWGGTYDCTHLYQYCMFVVGTLSRSH